MTGGAWDIPPAWLEQLTPGGRIVVPLRIRGPTRSVALERHGACWRSRSTEYCGFIPLRGAGHQPERNIRLDSDGKLILRIDGGQPADGNALRRSLGEAPTELWTGTTVTDKEKKTGLGDLDYWLATQYDLCRLLTRSPNHGLVAPVYGWGSMAILDQETLAYLMKRPIGETGESELGVCAYGLASKELASRAAKQIRAWDTGRRLATQIEVYPYGAPAPAFRTLLVADKRHIRVIVRVVPLADRTTSSLIHRYLNRLLGDMRSERWPPTSSQPRHDQPQPTASAGDCRTAAEHRGHPSGCSAARPAR